MSLDATRLAAARVSACVNLLDVRLWSFHGELESFHDETRARLSYRFRSDVAVQHSDENAMVIVLGSYTLAMRALTVDDDIHEPSGDVGEGLPADAGADEDDTNQSSGVEDVASVEFQLHALFEVDAVPDERFTDDELDAFGKTTGQFALYPYARELVANMTGRMGLPPLHLGVMRLDLESRDG